jgi:hypothetical protein
MARYPSWCSSLPPVLARELRGVFERMPELSGCAIQIEFQRPASRAHRLRPFGGEIHAGAFLRERRIVFEMALRRQPREFARIFAHELFHFAWLRLGNPRRISYERVLGRELRDGVPGELGWSAEWRKEALGREDRRLRSRRWREYACESFCDTAAWLYSGSGRHGEYTLPAPARQARRAWFAQSGLGAKIPV